MVEIKEADLERMLIKATEIGYTRCAIDLGMIKSHISKASAYKVWGRRRVDKAISEDPTILTESGVDRIKLELKLTLIKRLKDENKDN